MGTQVSRLWRGLRPPWPESHPHPLILTTQKAARSAEGHPEMGLEAGGCPGRELVHRFVCHLL